MLQVKDQWFILAFQPKFNTLDEVVGGDQVRPHELFTNFAQAGHQVHIWETCSEHKKERSFFDGSLIVRPLRARWGIVGSLLQLLEMRKILQQETAWAQENGYHRLCYYHQVPVAVVFRFRLVPMLTQQGILLFDLAKKLGMKVWANVHDLSPEHEHLVRLRAGKKSKLRYLYLKGLIGSWMQKRFLPKADFVAAASAPLRDALVARCSLVPERTAVLLAGYNKSVLDKVTAWDPPQRDAQWTVGYLGSPVDVSLELLVESVCTLNRKNVRLLLAGMGMPGMVEHLRSKWPNTEVVNDVRYFSYEKIANNTDLWVIPLDDLYVRDYTWPLKMPMALASGRPVVRTSGRILDLSGLKDYFFVSGVSPQEIASTIAGVMDNPDQAAAKARAGQGYVRKNLSWDTLAVDMLERLERVTLG